MAGATHREQDVSRTISQKGKVWCKLVLERVFDDVYKYLMVWRYYLRSPRHEEVHPLAPVLRTVDVIARGSKHGLHKT